MDGGILSYKVGLIKPDEAVYRRLIELYRLVPDECVFLDDVAENVDAAEAIGIHGIHFINENQAREELKKLGVG